MKFFCKLSLIVLTATMLATPKIANAQHPVSPELGGVTSWIATRELAADSVEAALDALKFDAPETLSDTLVHVFKLGVINARLGNTDVALDAFTSVTARDRRILAPLAWEQIGDIRLAAQDTAGAMQAYDSALRADGLPTRYRNQIFAKVRPLVNNGATIAASAGWRGDYQQWARRQRMLSAAALEAAVDSLIRADLVAEADTLLEQHLSGLARRDACNIINNVFSRRQGNPNVSTRFLFSLARQAHECRNFDLAERILTAVRARRDFSTAVGAKQALLLEANIAFSRENWRRAIELYTRYTNTHGNESPVIMNLSRANRRINNQQEQRRWQDLHIRTFPNHQQTQEILWLRAWNTEETRDFRAAAAAYRRIFGTQGRRTEEAHLRHALLYYRMGMFDSTITFLRTFQRQFPQSTYLWAGIFWQGKSHIALGDTAEAHRVWTNMARLDPTDYYAHRARQLMGISVEDGDDDENIPAWLDGVRLSRRFDMQVSNAEARAWLDAASPSSIKRFTPADSVAIRRGAMLLAAAMPETADMFLGEYERNFPGNLKLQYEMAAAYGIAGNYALAFRVSRRLAWRIPMERRERVPVQVLTVIFPPFYSSTITPNAERFDVDPLFVSAVMRQESIFDRNIVSPAGAIGLMQIMPATGRQIAQELRETFTVDSLYSYSLNIRFGTYYLRKRLTQFGGDMVLALCSYNAGPNNAARWRDRNRGREFDLFVEDIGFFETRTYVKKVLGNYWTYKVLAETPGYDYGLPFGRDPFPWVNDW